MKLVTGIEAIQSGKPWKDRLGTEWIEPNCESKSFTPKYLMLKEFIIKEEPREFWVRIEDTIRERGSMSTALQSKEWIRVREIEK